MDSKARPHLLAVPFSVQGHAKPLLNLCYRIASHGIKVTFVTTESLNSATISDQKSQEEEIEISDNLTFESVPDGFENNFNGGFDVAKLKESMKKVMPGHLIELAGRKQNMNESITAVIADASVGWVLDVAEEIGAQPFAFWPAAPGTLAYLSTTPNLNEVAIRNAKGDAKVEKMMLEMALDTQKTMQRVEFILCNTFCELDSFSCKLVPKILPVGPLKTLSNSSTRIVGQSEDNSCLEWLDKQETNSVVYVAFGGSGILSLHQFHELALGLELSGRPFLWVVRSGLADASTISYPDGFLERVSNFGKIVNWAPQEKVLAHPATACFLSHCGWNSIMEGISFGVPFLCWPYSGDQFFNQHYVSEALKIALKMDADENGVKSREEIRTKIEMLLISNVEIKANVLRLKDLSEKSMSKEGSSYENLHCFINQLKQ